ncbi:MAG: GNAT family N-acetyltransferase [Deltaproteobacteria bacterium]|nr:GNAT family N-acetyltransferase [Deltaproteobacteria bacterium]MBW1847213.1 GNAT family N-acetyltransferase [Deltaproteobacteria bacterium]MBW2179501.1 GNAT family N-acetyltransferase [Deltaproteobacteria bacterium]
MKKYTIQPYSSGEEEEIIKLLQLGYEGWPPFDLKSTPLNHWLWRYRENLTKQTIISVAKNGDKLIGCLHSIPRKMKVGDSVYVCCCGPDLVVLPGYREIGVASKLDSFINELRKKSGMEFVYFETALPFYFRSLKKKQPLYARMAHFVRIKDIGHHLDRVFYKRKRMVHIAFRFLYFFSHMKNLLKKTYASDSNIKISDINRFDERINKLWDVASDSYELMTERTDKYLNWRYCDPRGGDYIIKCAQEQDQILGYIVLRINERKKNYPVGYIVDILTLPNRFDVADALLDAAVHFFDMNTINIIHLRLVRRHSYVKLLKKYGFINSMEKKIIFFRPYGAIENEIAKILSDTAASIHITYGDDAFI